MAMFSRSKNEEPAVPETCARCGQRDGTVHLHYVTPTGAAASNVLPQPTWLCEACARPVRRTASQN